MSSTATGLLTGLLLAIAWTTGGFTGFLLAVVLGAVGAVVGLWRDGRIDSSSFGRGRPRA
ncbi:DUF2273 domain-containing protein [Aquipuribacter sp. SD81]|uniref:DUF2273 domain-containing protein n=1 Tax=Aquipuribacter sp. SD81 TaxID=3127703 RepID=UPI00301AC653